MNQHDHETSPTPRTKAYIECTQGRPKHCIPNHGERDRSLELTFDPDSFVCNPSEIDTHIPDQAFDGQSGDGRAGKIESDC